MSIKNNKRITRDRKNIKNFFFNSKDRMDETKEDQQYKENDTRKAKEQKQTYTKNKVQQNINK